ncbi:FGGY family carbohydrate kinase [Dictyobacter formicarum]|uniref:Carbohydrate kinase FGGY N-terminal domain-containing protein n=1 Tax=Dictyobacter formicarum TaxID=2778368 RepID=A0ABQ3V7V2_9CHLR|nr:FGGY family carbohydrate kinase [Dictyobacter formicarum]GHO82212.1 hypothetical protein KSZ_02180 [Dictyobacter formicarum]
MIHDGLVLDIDTGTGSLRVGLFNLQSQTLGFAECSYEYHPSLGRAEQHPASWWEALVGTVQECLAHSGINRFQRVKAH